MMVEPTPADAGGVIYEDQGSVIEGPVADEVPSEAPSADSAVPDAPSEDTDA